MRVISKSLEETENFARNFLESVLKEKCQGQSLTSGATVIALSGDLGAGKTTFMKGIAKAFGITEQITSPTFILLKNFTISPSSLYASRFTLLTHIDAYRLENPEEMLVLGWQKMIENPKNILFIEWPEKIQSILPKEVIKLSFKFVDEKTREIDFENTKF